MKETKEQKQKGITLISLVITIILLLILAAVAINLAVDNDGLFRKAGDAANSWNTSVADEQDSLGDLMGQLDNMYPTEVTVSTQVPSDWNTGIKEVATAGNRSVPIPEGFVVSEIVGEKSIPGGLVIYQTESADTTAEGFWTDRDENNNLVCQTTYSQYVWIPVDNINDMIMCKVHGAAVNLNPETLECPTCKEGNTETRLAGKLYGKLDISLGLPLAPFDSNLTGQTYDEQLYHEPDDVPGDNADIGEEGIAAIKSILNNTAATTYAEIEEDWNNLLQTDFEKMAKSVAKYKGFYISRYEINENVESKKDSIVMTGGTNEQMWYGLFNTLRNNPSLTGPTYSQMIWGSQYDQVIKLIGDEANIVHEDRQLSTKGEKSGSNELDKMKNIYDLEGNYVEWTSESFNTNTRLLRGGYCFSMGSLGMMPASGRDFSSYVIQHNGFRTSRAAMLLEL